MTPKRNIKIELHPGDEVLDKEVKSFGVNSGHIIVPGNHVGKKAKVIVNKKGEGE